MIINDINEKNKKQIYKMSNKDVTEINIIYYINKGDNLNIFGSKFVKNNINGIYSLLS